MTSDHGEFLGEHGLAGHGQAPFEPQVHVPLIVKYPGSWRGGEVVESRVSTIGVFATILRSLGLPLPEHTDSRPLDEEQSVWVEDVDSSGNRIRVGYDGSLKLAVTTTEKGTFSWLYDLTSDPEEKSPVRDGSGASFVPHLVDDMSGVGTQVTVGDLNGDALPDIVSANKKGAFVFLQRLGE